MGTGPPSLGPAAPQAPLDRSAAGGCRSGPQRGRRGRSPFKSRAAMICLVLGLFAGLFQTACSGAGERTFVAIKPDGVQRHLVGEIIRRFERKGLQLVGLKLLQVWQGLDVVKTVRTMIGETNPAESLPGTIRGDFCVEVSKNVIHGSDSAESAGQEISLWFRPEELICWDDTAEHWLYA
ncbi:nucleoside diphosphate kinase 3 isoform X4 [Calypte anna]|uniref:nucleoside diphosphate kinase 3 isoform X4 n=1 Tax=Calypte anna TaxID=9244 RepID=UPI0011C39FBC|nr:nucleoside diphosphate kinase 3 isoform X4 [Calypte anna]